jgi:hypothetical protein
MSRLDRQITAAFFGEPGPEAEAELADQPVPYTLTAKGEALAAREPESEPEAGL